MQVLAHGVASAHGVETAVVEAQTAEVVVLESATVQVFHHVEQLAVGRLPDIFILFCPSPIGWVHHVGAESGAVDALSALGSIEISAFYITVCHGGMQIVGLADLSVLHIDLDDAETGGEIGVDAVDTHVVDGLVLGHALAVVVGQIGDVVVVAPAHQVDVLVTVDDDQPCCLLAPGDVADGAVAQSVALVKGAHLAVGGIVGEEIARGKHIESLAALLYPGDVVIGHICLPQTVVGMGEDCRDGKEHGEDIAFHNRECRG